MRTITDLTEVVKKENIKEIALQFTDLFGILHTVWIPSKLLANVADDGVHVDGSSVGMVDVSASDVKLVPDLDSFVVLPRDLFSQPIARLSCGIYEPESDNPFKLDPRSILKKSINDAKKALGASVEYFASTELEHFLFRKSEDGQIHLLDDGRYLASPPADLGADFRLEVVNDLRNMGLLVEKHHHEVPPGKYELNLAYSRALEMADTIYLVKFLLKTKAAKRGLIASFMPKPFQGQYGCGLHTHINLFDNAQKKNLFSDPRGHQGLHKTALSFIAGILVHAKALAAITNPTVNSYKRLVPGWEAPVYISWAKYNRSVLVRVPPGKAKSTRLEYRPTDGSCNFYIAFAGMLAAGMDGIKRKLDPPEPIEEDIYKMSKEVRLKKGIETLPGNLGDALNEFSKDSYLQTALGRTFSEKFLQLKREEWQGFNTTVHDWERKKYLDI
jgi:glutamine synthetase